MAKERALDAYLSQLRAELAALDRFPPSARPQAVILGTAVAALVLGSVGAVALPVPGYLLLPFVLVPGWRLVRHERWWRATRRRLTTEIRLIEHRTSAR